MGCPEKVFFILIILYSLIGFYVGIFEAGCEWGRKQARSDKPMWDWEDFSIVMLIFIWPFWVFRGEK